MTRSKQEKDFLYKNVGTREYLKFSELKEISKKLSAIKAKKPISYKKELKEITALLKKILKALAKE